ncbi:hypothetical protein RCL1_000947 [Eukaryota sp. TZLM3-RCL]
MEFLVMEFWKGWSTPSTSLFLCCAMSSFYNHQFLWDGQEYELTYNGPFKNHFVQLSTDQFECIAEWCAFVTKLHTQTILFSISLNSGSVICLQSEPLCIFNDKIQVFDSQVSDRFGRETWPLWVVYQLLTGSQNRIGIPPNDLYKFADSFLLNASCTDSFCDVVRTVSTYLIQRILTLCGTRENQRRIFGSHICWE